MELKSAIYGLSGPALTAAERSFLKSARPWGIILFQRNCQSRQQVRALTDELRALTARDMLPILIDEEGGRVQRLKPPHWRARPPMRTFGDLFARNPQKAREAAGLNAQLIAADLREVGVNVDCIPCLDVPVPGAHDVIGNRAFSTVPTVVGELGRVVCAALLACGVLPVVKHIPGHGRSTADTHDDLPHVSASHQDLRFSDFLPFKALADQLLGMTAHIVYEALDKHRCATLSESIVRDIIRGEIGFDGLLMTDDLSMKALGGCLAERACGAFKAGCDLVLHCNGKLSEMEEVAGVVGGLQGTSLERANRAERLLGMKVDMAAAQELSRQLEEALA